MEIKEYIREYTLRDMIRVRNPKVVAFGGGTGLSSILRGLKKYTQRLTAIVSMGDDGGSSGMLREDLGMLPPGDIRNCILALADDENIMSALFNYRFDGGKLTGHSFGNLFLAAMTGISRDFYDAVRRTSDVLQIVGRVLPVTLDEMILKAQLKNGEVITGQSIIPKAAIEQQTAIDHMFLEKPVRALPETIEAIREADIIIFGPGSLYTSVIPHLLVNGIEEAVMASRAKKFYVGNLMTQPGETTDYTQEDHLAALQRHCTNEDNRLVKIVMCNDPACIDDDQLSRYEKTNSIPVISQSEHPDYTYIFGNFASLLSSSVRHNADALAQKIFEMYLK